MTDSERFRVADADRVRRLLDGMARRVAARTGDRLELVGVRRRGVPLSERLAARLEERGVDAGLQEVVLKRYADDLTLLHEQPELKEDPDLEVEGRDVLVVDDVLYTGRTLFLAAQIASAAGARRVRAAVLCTRGGNEVPVDAAFAALRLDVGPANVVEVHVPPYEDELGVELASQPD